jgi:Outer membrane receptor for ferrienterochelin and colicins
LERKNCWLWNSEILLALEKLEPKFHKKAMKKTTQIALLFLFLIAITLSAFAEKGYDITAVVKDSQTKEPIAFASVELLSAKDSLLTGAITDSKGQFYLSNKPLASKVRVRFMGYKTLETQIKNQNLGTLLLEEETTQLSEVAVKGSARVNKIDRDVYAVTKDLRAGTTSTQEMLGKLNGVNYNLYDKSISVNGSSKVLLLVDGVEKDQAMAKNIAPDRIDRIEVIKDPVGLYATEGYSAVINIIQKKDYSGVDAFITNSTFFDFFGTNNNDIFTQDYGNANINYTYKNLSVYSSGFVYKGNFNLPSEYIKRYGNVTSQTRPMDLDAPNIASKPSNGNFVFGTDYSFAKKHTLSAEFKYNYNYSQDSSYFFLTNSVNNQQTGTSATFSSSKNKTTNLQTGISYQFKIDDKNTFNANVKYYRTDGYNNNLFLQDNFSGLSNIDLSGDFVRTNLNFTHIFSPKVNVDLSYGNVYFSNTNKLNSSSFTRYNYRNRVSLYASYRPIQKLNAKVGGIVENNTQKYKGTSTNFTSFLPYVNIQYTVNKKLNVVAKYHSGTSYPSIDQLNPYKIAQDSLLYSVGNPGLKIGNEQTLGVDINIMNFITLSPYYTFNNSQITSFVKVDPDNSRHFLSETVNADKYKNYGVKLDFTLPIGKKIFWKNNINWFENSLEYNKQSSKANNWLINSTLIYMEPKKGFMAGLVLQKQMSRYAAVQGYNTNGNDLCLAMLRQSFLKQKLTIGLYSMLPIEMGLKYNIINTTNTASYYQQSKTSLNFIKNLTFFEISYRFSAGKSVKKVQTTDDDELKSSKKSGIGL